MIDVHTHILPAVDDGAQDMGEALAALENGVRDGVTTFVLTPHVKTEGDWERLDEVQRSFRELVARAADRLPGTELVLGAEVLLTPWLPERIAECPAIAVNAGNYLLMKNIVPVLAHPERYAYVDEEKALFEKWTRNGVLLQMNSGSLTGKFGFWVKRRAARMVKSGMVHLLASDIHSGRERYDLREAMKQAEKLNQAMTAQIFRRNAELVIGKSRPAPVAAAGRLRP